MNSHFNLYRLVIIIHTIGVQNFLRFIIWIRFYDYCIKGSQANHQSIEQLMFIISIDRLMKINAAVGTTGAATSKLKDSTASLPCCQKYEQDGSFDEWDE